MVMANLVSGGAEPGLRAALIGGGAGLGSGFG
jgi:hypothetical protein